MQYKGTQRREIAYWYGRWGIVAEERIIRSRNRIGDTRGGGSKDVSSWNKTVRIEGMSDQKWDRKHRRQLSPKNKRSSTWMLKSPRYKAEVWSEMKGDPGVKVWNEVQEGADRAQQHRGEYYLTKCTSTVQTDCKTQLRGRNLSQTLAGFFPQTSW